MNAAVLHTTVLYGGVAVALIPTALTLRRKDLHYELREILWAVWPFGLLAVLEALAICTQRLVAQIAVPCIATLMVFMFSRSSRVIRWSRRFFVVLAWAMWLHGGYLLAHGYMTNPRTAGPREQVEPRWYTPLTGLQPVVRPPRRP